jgi:hypothetical protein
MHEPPLHSIHISVELTVRSSSVPLPTYQVNTQEGLDCAKQQEVELAKQALSMSEEKVVLKKDKLALNKKSMVGGGRRPGVCVSGRQRVLWCVPTAGWAPA